MDNERPSDLDIAHYINDLEIALADARALCPTQARVFEAVHPWAEELMAPGGWVKAAGPDPLDDDAASGPSDTPMDNRRNAPEETP